MNMKRSTLLDIFLLLVIILGFKFLITPQKHLRFIDFSYSKKFGFLFTISTWKNLKKRRSKIYFFFLTDFRYSILKIIFKITIDFF